MSAEALEADPVSVPNTVHPDSVTLAENHENMVQMLAEALEADPVSVPNTVPPDSVTLAENHENMVQMLAEALEADPVSGFNTVPPDSVTSAENHEKLAEISPEVREADPVLAINAVLRDSVASDQNHKNSVEMSAEVLGTDPMSINNATHSVASAADCENVVHESTETIISSCIPSTSQTYTVIGTFVEDPDGSGFSPVDTQDLSSVDRSDPEVTVALPTPSSQSDVTALVEGLKDKEELEMSESDYSNDPDYEPDYEQVSLSSDSDSFVSLQDVPRSQENRSILKVTECHVTKDNYKILQESHKSKPYVKKAVVTDPSINVKRLSVFERSEDLTNEVLSCKPKKRRSSAVVDAAEVVPETDLDSPGSPVITLPGSTTVIPESDEEDIHPHEIVKDKNWPDIFITKLVKSSTTKTGRKKRTDRVYNTSHECPWCFRMFSNWATHIMSHKNKPEIEELLKLKPDDCDTMDKKQEKLKLRKKKLNCLRRNADHKHNLRVISSKKGELVLGRRSQDTSMDISEYGPCPHCEEWLKLTILKRHQACCPALDGGKKESKGVLLTQSAVMTGKLSHKASPALIKNVLSIMMHDEIGSVARSDPLIITAGNQWILRTLGNELNRATYTSQMMRLSARLLINLRSIHPLEDNKNLLMDYLVPEYFDYVVQATLACAAVDMDDEEELKTPSNAIKLGFEIKRVLASKKAFAIRAKDPAMKQDCSDFLELMESEWALKVTKLARVALLERSYNQKQQLPLPEDLKRLGEFLNNELSKVNLKDHTTTTFRRVSQLVESKLTAYNRRRSGEVQAIK